MNRREFLIAASSVAAATSGSPTFAARPPASAPTASGPTGLPADVVWHDVRDWGVEGRGFDDTRDYFDRLPARAQGVVREEVWTRSRHTSGMSARFETDAADIYLKYALLNPGLGMAHMPPTGVSGVDLYARLDDGGGDAKTWRFLDVHHPAAQTFQGTLRAGIEPGRRRYQLNLPLYNGVRSLAVGVRKSATFEPVAPRRNKPILFYGTSITQGGCASRPGMSFVSILGRRLDRPVLNFGFSGNGRFETAVGQFLAELDPAVYVIDCVANTEPPQILERVGPLVKQFRAAHEGTPILLLDERVPGNAPLVPELSRQHTERSAAIRRAYDDLLAAGGKNVVLRTGDFLGKDGEATVDGSHPSDLGMVRYADALEPVLATLLRDG